MTASIEDYILAGGFNGAGSVPTGIEDIDELEQGGFAMPNYLPGQEPVSTPGGGYAQAVGVGGQVSSATTAGRGTWQPATFFTPGRLVPTTTPAPTMLPSLSQGIDQATKGAPAPTGLGAIIGAGLGGMPSMVQDGTGALPGNLGNAIAELYGTSALPPGGTVPVGLARAVPVIGGGMTGVDSEWAGLAGHSERIGRAIVRRVLGVTEPQLAEIQQWIQHRNAQLQATAEHREIVNDELFKRNMLRGMFAIANRVGASISQYMDGGNAAAPAWRRY